MDRYRLHQAGLIVAAGVAVLLPAGLAQAQEGPSDRDEIVHVLNRITFGPRPGDVEAVEKMGLHNFIEQQLHPELIDDSAVESEVAQFDLLEMSPAALSQLLITEREGAAKKKLVAANGQGEVPAQTQNQTALPMQNQAGQEQGLAQDQTAVPMQNQNQAGREQAGAPPRQGRKMDPVAQANMYRSVAVIQQLEQDKLVRAVNSNRQLQEVLVDFWSNHFNIDMKKGPCRVYKVADDREVIRPHIWGKFRDLLGASAKSPAMLFYLDNAGNTVEHMVSVRQQERQAMLLQNALGAAAPSAQTETFQPKKQGGINENYAREIMELHTLGVDGGYTQKDVQEVARCFTGWTINRQTGEFVFRPGQHDNGEKMVLGHDIPAGGGIQDGEKVLDILCSEPACAHFISKEMCERFVSDDPPPDLVNRIATVFQGSGGDLRAVTEAILTSPEFLSSSTFGNKIKSPLEFAVSAVRASQSSIIAQQPPPFDKLVPTMEGSAILGRTNAADRIARAKRQSLNWHIVELGEPLFACTPPTGYKEVSKIWVSPGALIERLNFALALTQQQLSDIRFDPQNILAGTDLDKPEEVLNRCVATLLQDKITDPTRNVLMKTALPSDGASQTVNPAKLIALIIGSPEFQRK